MKAIAQNKYGEANVLELREMPMPEMKKDSVLVRICAAGLDRSAWHKMTGLPYLGRAMFGLRGPKNPILGMDMAGRVEAVGEKVTRFQTGDEVFGICDGSFAEYGCTGEDKLVLKPASLTFEQAATVPISACTALKAIRDVARVEAGQRMLIIGASGGVGSFSVQIAKAFGAHVTGVCSSSKMELVRSIGADQVIDYTKHDIMHLGHSYDVILDIGGNRPLPVLRRALSKRGTLVIAGGEGGDSWFGVGRQFRALFLSPFVSHSLRSFISIVNREALEAVKELIDLGKLIPVVNRVYPLAEVPDAMRYLEGGKTSGKIAIAPC